MTREAARRQLLQIYTAALRAVDGRILTRDALSNLATESPLLASSANRSVSVFAIGKAAASMTLGAGDALGSRLRAALVITRPDCASGLAQALPLAQIIESAHPLPDARSLAAGAALLAALRRLDVDTLPLFLISGGASSLVEVLREGVSLERLRECNEDGLASGIAIEEFNARRSALSQLKGGRLAELLEGRAALALFISDVPGDEPAIIGSGLMGPAPRGDAVYRQILASGDLARDAAVCAARGLGLRAQDRRPRFAGDAQSVAQHCIATARVSEAELLVWCGESTVRLPANPGRGGRNQHLALAAALALDGCANLCLLAAGTDGSDGHSGDAGALVDGGSCARMRAEGFDPSLALQRADAGSALAAAADLVNTGPTGTNVGDLVMSLRTEPALGMV